MNVLILGKGGAGAEAEILLSREGVGTATITDAADIIKFKGEPGDYQVTTAAGLSRFAAIIVTEPLRYDALAVDGGLTMNLMDDMEAKRFCELKTSEKIVLLLDYAEETPEYIAARAIGLAKRFTEMKKEVVFLSKVVKSGYDGGEQRYREARETGVVFFRYDAVTLSYDEEEDRFGIHANDGVLTLDISTPFVLSAVSCETPELKAIAKKFRLRTGARGAGSNGVGDGAGSGSIGVGSASSGSSGVGGAGSGSNGVAGGIDSRSSGATGADGAAKAGVTGLNNDMFFLAPAFSSRRGIYYIPPACLVPDGGISLEKSVRSILQDIAAIGEDGYLRDIVQGWGFPEVDPGKCAFCYSCYRACPHGALEPDMEASAMKVVESACEACGACIAICPGEAIAWKSDDANTGHNNIPVSRCKVYLCENGAAAAFDEVLPLLGGYGQAIDSERVACGGSVGIDKLAADLRGYEKIVVACCFPGACRHIDGDRRACKQAERAAGLLQKAGLEGRSVHIINASHAMPGVLMDKLLGILKAPDSGGAGNRETDSPKDKTLGLMEGQR